MHRIIFLDPEIIQNLKIVPTENPDPEIVEAVEKALSRLDPEFRQFIRERYFEGLSLKEIAARNQLPEPELIARIYEARRRLKILLASFVKERWGIIPEGVCRVCLHPEKEKIEAILRTRSRSESWRITCGNVERALDEKIHPPQILKAHLKHMK